MFEQVLQQSSSLTGSVRYGVSGQECHWKHSRLRTWSVDIWVMGIMIVKIQVYN